MKDQGMLSILSKFDEIETDTKETGIINESKKTSDPMLDILAGFDAVERQTLNEDMSLNSGPGAKFKKQMPGTHKMAKNTGKKHPAAEYLVGGEEGEPKPGEKVVAEEDNPKDTISIDIPLLIRMLEYARENAKSDMELHNVAEKMIDMSKTGETLTMNDYENIVDGETVEEDIIAPKMTFGDIYKSLDEREEERKKRLEREFHTEIKKQKLKKAENGKYELDERTAEILRTVRKEIYHTLKNLSQELKGLRDVKIASEVLRELEDILYTVGYTSQSEEKNNETF